MGGTTTLNRSQSWASAPSLKICGRSKFIYMIALGALAALLVGRHELALRFVPTAAAWGLTPPTWPVQVQCFQTQTSSTPAPSQEKAEAEDLPVNITALPEPRRPCLETEESKDLPWLLSLRRWESSIEQPRESITLMTQLSADRLNMLENQCRTWPDKILAAVYIPIFTKEPHKRSKLRLEWESLLNATQEDVLLGIDSFHGFMERTARCALDIELLGHFMDPDEPEPYPINALRNKALLAAKTDMLFLLDVDFMAAADLDLAPPGYRDPAVYDELLGLVSQRVAVVVPAFEITNRQQDLVLGQNYARNMLMGKSTSGCCFRLR